MGDGARQADPQKAMFLTETPTKLREQRDALENARYQDETLQAEKDRIAARLHSLEADDGALDKAKREADTAREQLEEAEAVVILGDADVESVKAAKGAADKGQKALDEAETSFRQQQAVRRGLSRKLEEATTYHDTLENSYNQAVIRIRGVDLATHEAALVKMTVAEIKQDPLRSATDCKRSTNAPTLCRSSRRVASWDSFVWRKR